MGVAGGGRGGGVFLQPVRGNRRELLGHQCVSLIDPFDAVPERLGAGLQNRKRRFESARHLQLQTAVCR